MGFDNDCILNIQSLAGEYFCGVCRTLAYPHEAVQAPCTHLYCKPCITYVASTTQVCPYDQYRVTEADCKPLSESNKVLADTIGKIQVHCLYYRTGCTWQGPLSDCTTHCSTCAFGESAVLCNRCGIQLKHRQVQEHAQICSGVQSQVQQQGGGQDSTSNGTGAAVDQTATVDTGVQAQKSQASTPLVSSQDANQASSVSQPQAAMPTPEQWYQQQQQQYQQQYQQYYQQYPGYDPYQQSYQYYYQYPQAAQQYQQQHMQPYPQGYVQPQPQPQVYGQTQNQPQGQAQPLAQAQPQPQVTAHGTQPPLQPQAQSAVNAKPLLQSVGQAQPQIMAQGQAPPQMSAQGQAPPQMPAQGQTQPQMPAQGQAQHQMPAPNSQMQAQGQAQPQMPAQGQAQHQMPAPNSQMQAQGQAQPQMPAQGHAQPQMSAQGQAPPPHAHPYNQSQALHQVQPYSQTQLPPQQQMQVSLYPQTQPQVPLPHTQPYPQSQTPYHAHPQPQMQSQSHSHPNQLASAHLPQHPVNPSTQFQTPNTVTGYQSYPHQQIHSQGPGGAAPLGGAQQMAQYPSQIQGQLPPQTAHMRPPQPYSRVPNQQQHAMMLAQGQPPSRPSAQQLTVHPHAQAQQPGYSFPPRPGVQAPQHAAPPQYAQQPLLPGQGPSMQPHLQAQGLSQMLHQSQQSYIPSSGAHNYGGRPTGPAVGLAGVGQVRPAQLNQNNSMKTNNQLPAVAQQAAQSQRGPGGEKPRDHGREDVNKQARGMGATFSGGNKVTEMKVKAENGFTGSANGSDRLINLSGSRKVPDGDGNQLNNHVQDGKPKTEKDAGEESVPGSGDTSKSGAEESKDAVRKAEAQDLKQMSKSTAGDSAPASALPQSHSKSQVQGTNSISSVDQGRNQPQSVPYGSNVQHRTGAPSMPQSMSTSQQPALLGHPPKHLRPQGPGLLPPSVNSNEKPSGGILGTGSSASFGRPGNASNYQNNFPPHQGGLPQNALGDPLVETSFAGPRPGAPHAGMNRLDVDHRTPFPTEVDKFTAQRSGYFDGREPELHPRGPMERTPYGPGVRAILPAAGMRDERAKQIGEEHMKHFPHGDFEDDFRKFPRPPPLEAGPSSNYGAHPSSGPLDHVPRMFSGDGMPRSFDKGPHGFERDPAFKLDSGPSRVVPPFFPNDSGEGVRVFPDDDMGRGDYNRQTDFSGLSNGPGFTRHRIDGMRPRSPGRDYPGFPSRRFGPHGDVVGNESRPFEGSKPYNFASDPFGKQMHEGEFPAPMRGDFDLPGNVRVGEHLGGPPNQDMLPSHLRRGEHVGLRGLHLGESAAFGPRGGLLRMGGPPMRGNFSPHVPFGDPLGVEKLGHPLAGDPGFRSGFGFPRYAHDGGFDPMEMDPFDNLRKRKPGSIICRICRVECGSIEGLDLHSQSRDHQRKARDMVLSIKQHNKKQKFSKDQTSTEEGRDGGRPKNSGFQGRGIKR